MTRTDPAPIGEGLYARLDALVDPGRRQRILDTWRFGSRSDLERPGQRNVALRVNAGEPTYLPPRALSQTRP